MVDKKKLSRWLLDNYKTLELRSTQFNWVSEWLPGFHDFGVSITIGGRIFHGRGMASHSQLAFEKAGAEAIERAFCYENGISSSGVAAHPQIKLAQIKAQDELIERDRFFCHYLTKTPFQKMSMENFSSYSSSYERTEGRTQTDHLGEGHGGGNPTPSTGENFARATLAGGKSKIDFQWIQKKLNRESVDIQVFEMTPLNETRSFICISDGKEMGLTVGLGASCEGASFAIEKAILECLINTVHALINRDNKPSTPKSFVEDRHQKRKNRHQKEENHHQTGKNHPQKHDQTLFEHKQVRSPRIPQGNDLKNPETYDLSKAPWLMKDSDHLRPKECFPLNGFEYHSLNSSSSILKEAPLVIIQCKNSYLQQSLHKNPDLQQLNLQRLNQFLGKPISVEQINSQPHPLECHYG